MDGVEYVYEKPRGIRSHKRLIEILLLIIIVFSAYFLYTTVSVHNQTFIVGGQTFTIPSSYRGTGGLQYIRDNYASSLAQVRDLCTSNFKGVWTDTPTAMGCYNMQGFLYCGVDDIRSLTNMCSSIGGTPICDSTRVSCEL